MSPRRESAAVRAHAAAQLRHWHIDGSLGLNLCAHRAMVRAAERLGCSDIGNVGDAHGDMMSEAIEDVESAH